MTKLTTHVLDIYSGKPGKGIKVDLYFYKNDDLKSKINTIVLNNDGRSDKALIEGVDFKEGKYELIFFVGADVNLAFNSPRIAIACKPDGSVTNALVRRLLFCSFLPK